MANPEALLISAVLRTGEYQPLMKHGITSEMFHAHDEEMRWVETYVQKYQRTPSRTTFKATWPGCPLYKTDDVDHWCESVKKAHARHVLVSLLDKAIDGMDNDLEKAVGTLHAGLSHVQALGAEAGEDFDVFSSWESTFADVSDRVNRVRQSGQAGIPSGFPTLDGITGGVQAGWLGVVAARLGVGKTWTGVRMACTAAFAGHKVAYFSLEQSRHQIALRAHTFASGKFGKETFKSLDLVRGKGFNLREYQRFLESLKVSGRFQVIDTARGQVTPMTIAGVLEQQRPDIVFIDYLTLMSTTGKGDDWRATARLSAELQQVAQTHMVPIIAISQVNRLGIGKEPPGAEHLSQSDAIGQDADMVVTMMPKSASVLKMKLAKFRHGPSGIMWFCRFTPNTGHFDEISGDDAAKLIEKDNEVP